MSVLMDNCSVMRGVKHGVEKLLKKQAKHLLNIDGDSVHHAHNAGKEFSAEFGGYVENVINLIFADFKFTTNHREYLEEICTILNIKYTVPERFILQFLLNILYILVFYL